ncbi:uncharacterized protein LOC112051055 [Bicyclus anynana]|uniref:Uncharacterized protein LOC112051055 n=1 Tax=Bicyclus anynana TaxID=110368 RepID=A0A6J1NBZ5_BICAN|nr:uncharacterized protein LOC112051055 [Bicyclus anynana]
MKRCVFRNCGNTCRNTKTCELQRIVFFCFPGDPYICAQWTSVVAEERKEQLYQPTESSYVCSIHFDETDILHTDDDKTWLRVEAVPKFRKPKAGSDRKFHVVQATDNFNDALLDNYACIPSKWIRYGPDSSTVVVAYPNDKDPLKAKIRAKYRKKVSSNWNRYVAKIKYKTDSFKDGENWIMKKKAGKNPPNTKEEDKGLEVSDPKAEIQSMNKKLTSVNQTSSSPRENNQNPSPSTSFKRPHNQAIKEVNPKRTKVDKSGEFTKVTVNNPVSACMEGNQSMIINEKHAASDDSHATANQPSNEHQVDRKPRSHETVANKSTHIGRSKGIHLKDDDSFSQTNASVPKNVPTNFVSKHHEACETIVGVNDSNCNAELPSASNSSVTAKDEPSSTGMQTLSRLTLQNILHMLSNLININLSQLLAMENNLRNSMNQITEMYEKALESEASNASDDSFNIKLPASNIVLSETSQISEEKQAEAISNSLCIKEDIYEAPREHYNLRYAIVMPLEYDPNNSKWTLNHPEFQPGLEELLPRTGIYVDSIQLAYCKQSSNDCNTLAEMLLPVVFSLGALSVCTLISGMANTSATTRKYYRPALDKKALFTLQDFVENFGRERGWTFDVISVCTSLQDKVLEMRALYGKTYLYKVLRTSDE